MTLSLLDGLASFKSFLKSEFSEENLEFWIACEDFKKTKSPAKMAEKAKKIYEEFIQTEAPKEVGPAGSWVGVVLRKESRLGCPGREWVTFLEHLLGEEMEPCGQQM